jgi:zinc protease
MRKKLLTILSITALACSAFAQEKLPDNFFLKKLNNGLEVLVIEDANVPLATIEICVKNGSYTEPPEYNGLSHLYEHMFFKANKKYPSQKAFLDRVNELGISFNGTTSNERVNYFVTLSKDKVGEGLDFINNAIRYPLFDTAEMRRENPVVAGEFQRNESNPFFGLFQRMSHEMWGDLYSRKNVIGDYNIIYTATTEKMNVIKNKYYFPNNSLLAVCGDVDHNKIFAEVEKIYGDWAPSGFDPFQKWPIPEFKPLEYSEQFVLESENARVPLIFLGYHGPDTRNDLNATYAADVFSYILQQKNAKLQQDLVESGLAFQAQVSYQTCKYTGPIQIIVVPNPRKVKEAYEVLWKNINEWDSDNYFTDEQLQTAKDQLSISEIYNMEKPSQFIHSVSYWWCSATIGYYTGYVDNLQRVTREDIKNYVKKYIKGRPYIAGMMVREGMVKSMNIDQFFANTLEMSEYALQFNAGDAALTDSANAAKMNSLIQWLKINPTANIKVEAYTYEGEQKNTGTTRYNNVIKALTDAGIPETRIIGTMNKKFQVVTTKAATEDDKKANRKVEFTIVKNS